MMTGLGGSIQPWEIAPCLLLCSCPAAPVSCPFRIKQEAAQPGHHGPFQPE